MRLIQELAGSLDRGYEKIEAMLVSDDHLVVSVGREWDVAWKKMRAELEKLADKVHRIQRDEQRIRKIEQRNPPSMP